MKAVKLPSGSYRCRAYADGERRSFTAPTKKEAELLALEWQNGKKKSIAKGLTVEQCVSQYISSKENILSPTTVDGYRRSYNNNLAQLGDVYVADLTALQLQQHINTLSLTKSAKTIKNAYGLLISALNVFAPELHIRCTLPKVQKQIKHLPNVDDILRVVIGTEIELPCLLALWCGLRMSEIRGAKKYDIDNGILTIRDTIVTVDGQHIEKHSTKTIDSTRRIALPERLLTLISALPEEQQYLTELSGQAIYKRFTRLLDANALPQMRFHDLRHMNASIMLALGVPDKYAMERGGWSSPNIMKSVYQHTFSSERESVDHLIDDYFNSLLDSKLDTNNCE